MTLNLDLIKSIKISEGQVSKITSNNSVIWKAADVIISPINDQNQMPCAKITVSAGDVVVITYFLTKAQGYIYDARKCGLSYYGTVSGGSNPISENDLNKECSITLNIPQDGYISIGSNSTIIGRGDDTPGQLSNFSGDIPVGKYIKIKIN